MFIYPHVYKKLGYDPAKDLAPISQLANIDFCLVSGPKSNVKNVAEMQAKAKSDPSTASFGSSGNGTVPHFLGLMMGEAAGVELQHVPYQGGAPAMNALMGGHITAESAPAWGSEFKCAVTLGIPAASQQALPSEHPTGLRILIVDDHPLAREVLGKSCTAYGWHPTAVGSGAAALAELRCSAARNAE